MNRILINNFLTHDINDHQDDLDKEISMLFRENGRLQLDDNDAHFDCIDPEDEIWNTFSNFNYQSISGSDSEDLSLIFDQDIQDPNDDQSGHIAKDINIKNIPRSSVSPPRKRFRPSSENKLTQFHPQFEAVLATNNTPIFSKTLISPESFHKQHKEALSKLVVSMKRSAFSRNLIYQQSKVCAFH